MSSGQEFSEFDRASLGFTRSDSVQSAVSEQSNHDDNTLDNYDDSVDLLAESRTREESDGNRHVQGNQEMAPGLINEDLLRRAFKRAMEPLMNEVKKVKKESAVLDKKVTQVLAQNETLQKLVKELKSELNKGVEDLPLLLTGDGVQFLKQICVENLDMKAKEETEVNLLQKFMDKAREIRLRVAEDFSNQTPQSSSKLPKTTKFIREHLNTTELSNEVLHVLHNYAYTVLKYNNKGIEEETMSEAEKKIKAKAKQNIWTYAMERVLMDRNAKKEASSIRDKIFRILQTGVKYDPY